MIDSGSKKIIDNVLTTVTRDVYALPFMFRNTYTVAHADEKNCSLNTLPCGFLIGDARYLDYEIKPIDDIACIKAYSEHVYQFEFEADIDSLGKISQYPTLFEEIGLFIGKFDTPSKSCNVLQNSNTCKWISAEQSTFASYNISVYDEKNTIVYTEEKKTGLSNKINFADIMKIKLESAMFTMKHMKLTGSFTVNPYSSTTPFVGLYFNSEKINYGSITKDPHQISDTIKTWKFTIS